MGAVTLLQGTIGFVVFKGISCRGRPTLIGNGMFSVLITVLPLTLSAIVYIFSKQKPKKRSLLDNLSQEESEEKEVVAEEKQDENAEEGGEFLEYSVKSNDLYSETESSNDHYLFSSEDSDADFQVPDCSDDSISDEESLFEISIPSGHYLDYAKKQQKEEDNKLFLQYQKPQDFSAETVLFKQHCFMDQLADMNEDNLIEIDISMGSIKCSSF